MKEATGELNMTIVTIVAVALILAFVVSFLPQMLGSISNKWSSVDSAASTGYVMK